MLIELLGFVVKMWIIIQSEPVAEAARSYDEHTNPVTFLRASQDQPITFVCDYQLTLLYKIYFSNF